MPQRGSYSGSGRLLAAVFSRNYSMTVRGFSVRLRRLGTAGIFPFQINPAACIHFSYPITDFLPAQSFFRNLLTFSGASGILRAEKCIGFKCPAAGNRPYGENRESCEIHERYRHCKRGASTFGENRSLWNPEKAVWPRRCASQENCLKGVLSVPAVYGNGFAENRLR